MSNWKKQEEKIVKSIAVHKIITPFVFSRFPRLGDRLFWSYHKFSFKDKNFCARPRDWYAVHQILVNGDYDFVKEIFKEGDKLIIIDGGANIGMFSLKMFSFFPYSTIYAVEPSSQTFQVLKLNKNMNKNYDWRLYHTALAGEDGTFKFRNYNFLSAKGHVSEEGDEIVPSLSLESLMDIIKTEVDMLKMDIEGSEEETLYSNPKVLSKIKLILMQIHPERCNQERIKLLLKEHYKYLFVVEEEEVHDPYLLSMRGGEKRNPLIIATSRRLKFKGIREADSQ